jgi:DNA adenine methylase
MKKEKSRHDADMIDEYGAEGGKRGKPAERRVRRNAAGKNDSLQTSMSFEDTQHVMLNSPPVKKIADKSFTVHKDALGKVPESPPETNSQAEVVAQPFVKWVGGKRSLLSSIKPLLPARFKNYYEGFVGGGALFFAVGTQARHCYLSDNNLDLIITYQVIKADPARLIDRLKLYAASHSKDEFYRVRAAECIGPVEVAARFIYLNRTCFNGLYRVNKSGTFNVPLGDYKNPNIVQEENILACHKLLQNTTITYHEYDRIDPMPRAGDFVYLDPPYHPTTDDSFTAYTKENFTEQDQSNLRDFALKLHKAGAYVMLSNSKTKFIADLYSDKAFRLHTVQAPRMVNCKPNQRGVVDEFIITNY